MTDLILWTDIETTGLSYDDDLILSIAAIVTPVDEPEKELAHFDVIGQYGPHAMKTFRERAVPKVREMHDESGLWEKCIQSEISASEMLVEFEKFAAAANRMAQDLGGSVRLGGSSARMDMEMLCHDLPNLRNILHYRILDVSSIAYFAHERFGVPYMEKEYQHEAMADIRETIAEYQYVTDNLGRA